MKGWTKISDSEYEEDCAMPWRIKRKDPRIPDIWHIIRPSGMVVCTAGPRRMDRPRRFKTAENAAKWLANL